MRPKRGLSEVSICCRLKPNLDLLPKSFIIFDGEDEFTNSLECGSHFFHLNLCSTEPRRVITSTGFFEQYFKTINF